MPRLISRVQEAEADEGEGDPAPLMPPFEKGPLLLRTDMASLMATRAGQGEGHHLGRVLGGARCCGGVRLVLCLHMYGLRDLRDILDLSRDLSQTIL